MNKAVLSGDIIAYTTFSLDERSEMVERIMKLFSQLKEEYQVFSRIFKGDYIECFIENPKNALRVALIIKYFIKSISLQNSWQFSRIGKKESRRTYFNIYGVRLAIGIGKVELLDLDKGIFEGEAISFSGRIISKEHSFGKKRIVIKDTLLIKTNNPKWDQELSPLLSLIDTLIAKNTPSQCEVLIEKLFGMNELDIAEKMKISQSAVNQRSTAAGWYAIEKAILRFEQVIH